MKNKENILIIKHLGDKKYKSPKGLFRIRTLKSKKKYLGLLNIILNTSDLRLFLIIS